MGMERGMLMLNLTMVMAVTTVTLGTMVVTMVITWANGLLMLMLILTMLMVVTTVTLTIEVTMVIIWASVLPMLRLNHGIMVMGMDILTVMAATTGAKLTDQNVNINI